MYGVNTGCHKAGDDHHTIAGPLCSDWSSTGCTPAMWHTGGYMTRVSRVAAVQSFARISVLERVVQTSWVTGVRWHGDVKKRFFSPWASGALYWSDLSYHSGCWSTLIKSRAWLTGSFSSFPKVSTWHSGLVAEVTGALFSLLLRWIFAADFWGRVTIWWAEI